MTLGLVLTALGLGLRHGVDWDHIAAITDLTSSARDRRSGVVLSFLYAVGHAAVVFLLGAAAILFGAAIPAGVDVWMGRVVGLTLIALGAWVIVQLLRHGRDFRLRSRWMLVLRGAYAGVRRVRRRGPERRLDVEHAHDHDHAAADADHQHVHGAGERVHVPVPAGAAPSRFERWQRHRHRHAHDVPLADDPFDDVGGRAAAGIGVLHGVGVESPTQIAVFVAATSVGGAAAGLTLLGAWIVGLVVANLAIAVLAGVGVLHAERSFTIYAVVAVLVAVASVAMGILLVTGIDALPTI